MRNYDDDDNRIIADMSGVEQRSVLSSWLGIMDPNVRSQHGPGRRNNHPGGNVYGATEKADSGSTGRGTGYSDELSPEDKRALIFYAMKYSFGIGMVFLTVFGLVILLLTLLWK